MSTDIQNRNRLRITDTTLRDGHQSLYATRMRTEDMLEVAAELDKLGFHSLEVWGGATFDVMHRYLQENPFDRLRQLRRVAPRTPFQMLLRGQNLVGYRNYPDDVVETFIKHAADVGVDIFRTFDALNDPRNIEKPAAVIKACGKHLQGVICYTITERRIGGPVFNEEYYLEKARGMVELGADSLCIKDMAGMICPQDAEYLVKLYKKHFDIPLQLHTHFTSGMAAMAYMRAIDAGVDVVDCALAPFAMRSSQPAIEPIVVSLDGHPRDTGLDLNALADTGALLEKVAPKLRQFRDTSRTAVIDTGVLIHQTPGGMQSNMVNQLKQANALDRLPEVYEELPRCRADLGTVPLVTPTSQIVGTQAVMNVLSGRYKVVSQQVKDMCYGLYGKTPTKIDPKVQATCLKGYERGETPITCRPADVLEPEMDEVVDQVKAIYSEAGRHGEPDMDHICIYALYPRTGKDYLRYHFKLTDRMPGEAPVSLEDVKREDELINKAITGELEEKRPEPELPEDAQTLTIALDGEVFEVQVAGDPLAAPAPIPTPSYRRRPTPATPVPAPVASRPAPAVAKNSNGSAALEEGQSEVSAPMAGTVIEYMVSEGDSVTEGQALVTLEAMKMSNEIVAPTAGTVAKICSEEGANVARGERLVVLSS
ncbi:MAG: carboxylase [Planctomycetota bacterium]|nr:MAG: carboxylase [Planctomycetota bacterium]